MRKAGLEEAQAGIKIASRNINNFRYADDTIFMAESEEELKSLLMKGKEKSEKVGLKLNIQKAKIMASGPITSWQIEGETVAGFFWGDSSITADGDCSHEMKRCYTILRNSNRIIYINHYLKYNELHAPTKRHRLGGWTKICACTHFHLPRPLA